MPNPEAPRAYPEGSNFPILMAPVSPDSGELSHDLVKNRSLPAWRRAAIGSLALVGGLTATGTSPALAGGNRMLVTASAEGTAECIDDPNIMTVNREYADKIASGEIVIAIGDVPIAALEEGTETAVITGTPVEEILQNLITPTPECSTGPTPTFEASLLGQSSSEPVTLSNLTEEINAFYDNPANIKAKNFKDMSDQKLTQKLRKTLLDGCSGETKSPYLDLFQSRISSCTFLISTLWERAVKFQSSEMLKLAQDAYWYSLTIKTKQSEPEYVKQQIDGFLEASGIVIREEQIAES